MHAQHTCTTPVFEPFPDSALVGSIVDRFGEQVARHRNCVAVVDRGRAFTYGALDGWANGIMHAITERADTRTEPVALVVAQGVGYAAAVLGTLKSGCPYVPLEPTDPSLRLRELVVECGAHVVLADAESRDVASAIAAGIDVIQIDEVPPRSAGLDVHVGPDSVAYIFFTSGSTGAPKGVYDTHRNVLHNVLRYTNILEIAPADRLTLLQGPSFSGCVSSQFGALLNGAASYPLRLADEGLVGAAEWLRDERITIYHSVPSIFRAIVRQGGEFGDVRVVRLEGDRATSEDVELWKRHFSESCVLANGLGTTETGLARQLILQRGDACGAGLLPVGYPVRDMAVLVVDERREPVARGGVGEIAVASRHLALGYWRRPDLTAERFESRNGTRLYFTGDLGRLRPDGCLEYVGRMEADLKVLGIRVEPAEVEREILRLDGVRDAAVAIRAGPRGDGRVVAFVVTDSSGIDLQSVRAALADRLPATMLPTSLVEVDALPLGLNGKIDRRALPDLPARGAGVAEHASAREEWLARIWADVLGVDSIGPEDDFFALGGDSLAAAEIVARIEAENGRSLPLGILVRAPTVAALDAVLLEEHQDFPSSLTVLRGGSELPLVLLHGNTGNTLHYAHLVERLSDARALWALEYTADDDLRIQTIASRHVETLLDRQPEGPYHLVGFCYGAVVAHEMALQLADQGCRVEFLALLGLTPLEFPTLLAAGANARWSDVYGPERSLRKQVRHHARRAAGLSGGEAVRYLSRRGANFLSRPLRRESAPMSEVHRAMLAHNPRTYPGHAVVVLHALDASAYTSDPERDWEALAETVDVVVLPGADHDMLKEPGVGRLAEILNGKPGTASASPPPHRARR